MTLLWPTVCACLRALVVASLSVASALAAARHLRGLPAQRLAAYFLPSALVLLAPTMLAGYGWLPTLLRWPTGSAGREIFYGAMLWLRLMPVALLAMWFAPPGPSAAALHSWRMAGRPGGVKWRLRTLGASPVLAGAAVFLLAFQEFDMATSWGIRTWTVALFDAQVGGLALGESLRLAALPLLVEIITIAPLLCAARKMAAIPFQPIIATELRTFIPLAIVKNVFAPVALVLIPAWKILHPSLSGFGAWWESMSFSSELLTSLAVAAVSAAAAWSVTGLAGSAAARWVLVLPGLLGMLLLSLLLLALFQTAPLHALGGTLAPLLLALTLQLLPLAFLLRLLLALGAAPAALHTAQLAGVRRVQWALSHAPAWGAGALLFGVAYGDFTAGTLLAPPQFTPVFARILNLMHYGQSAVLSASVFVAVALPLAGLWLTRFLLRAYLRCCVR